MKIDSRTYLGMVLIYGMETGTYSYHCKASLTPSTTHSVALLPHMTFHRCPPSRSGTMCTYQHVTLTRLSN